VTETSDPPPVNKGLYRPDDLASLDYSEDIGDPGQFPYTRGIYPEMYLNRPWTMRQYAGFGTAEETNERFRFLLDNGQTGLSCAFDLPTQMGYDADHQRAEGEVGKVGVSISSVEDMHRLLADLPLDKVTTSMTINATASVLLLLYQIVAEERGVSARTIGGTIQNDILKEYVARGTYIFPPRPSMRIVTDIFAYCAREIPRWNTISISGYHIREAGSTASQELAFTLANGIAYVQAAKDAGLDVDSFAPRLSFFWNAHNDLFVEVAKYRASRRLWAKIMRDRFHAKSEKSLLMRFHTQTGGSTLTAQQPEVNIVRVAIQALAAVLGGTQSLHTNGFDEALGLPTENAAKLALRTQQVIAHESGATRTVDPLGGSYYVESLTSQIEQEATSYLDKIDEIGGAVAAIESNYMQSEIEQAAYEYTRSVDSGATVVVGVNRYVQDNPTPQEVFPLDPAIEHTQVANLARLKSQRSGEQVARHLQELSRTAREGGNLLYPMKEALRARATLGEVSDCLRNEFGTYE